MSLCTKWSVGKLVVRRSHLNQVRLATISTPITNYNWEVNHTAVQASTRGGFLTLFRRWGGTVNQTFEFARFSNSRNDWNQPPFVRNSTWETANGFFEVQWRRTTVYLSWEIMMMEVVNLHISQLTLRANVKFT